MSFARQLRHSPKRHAKRDIAVDTLVVFGVVFIAVLVISAPRDATIDALKSLIPAPPVDQHFSGCDAARAAGRVNITSSDPSYRASMDGDGDGLACEPFR